MNSFFDIFVYFWYALFFGLIIFLYVKNSLEYKSEFKNKDVTSIPKFFGPHLLSFLLYKKITNNVFSATIQYLIKKEAILIKSDSEGLYFLDNSKNVKLSRSQKYIIEILFKDISLDEKLTLAELNSYIDNNHKCAIFYINLQLWKRMMYKEIADNKYYEQKKMYDVIKWYRNLTFIVVILNYFIGNHSLNGYFIIFPAYFLMISFYYVYKRTRTANDEYYKWLSYKKYLAESETDNNLFIPAIVLNVSKSYAKNTKIDESPEYQIHLLIMKLINKSIFYGNRGTSGNRNK